MIQLRQNLALAEKPMTSRFRARAHPQRFDGDGVAEFIVGADAFIDRAHAPFAEDLGDAVWPDYVTLGEGWPRRGPRGGIRRRAEFRLAPGVEQARFQLGADFRVVAMSGQPRFSFRHRDGPG